MELIKLRNPASPRGSDIIDANFVAREDEIKKYDEKLKMEVITNGKTISFPAGTEKSFDKKTAEYILGIWGFIEKIGEYDVRKVEEPKEGVPPTEETNKPLNNNSLETEFAELKALKGWLRNDTKERYEELKKLLNK